MRHRLNRIVKMIGSNKAEAVVLGLGSAALAWELVAPDKSRDMISHAAYRHQVVTAVVTFVLGMHLNQVWRRFGLEHLDPIIQFGKQFGLLEMPLANVTTAQSGNDG